VVCLKRIGTSKAVEINRVRRHLSPRVNLGSTRRLRREIAEATDIALDVVRRATKRTQTQTSLQTGSAEPPLSNTQSKHRSIVVADCQPIKPPNYPYDQTSESPKLNKAPKKRDIEQFLQKSQKYGSRVVGLLSSTACPSKSLQSKQADLNANVMGGLPRSPVKSFNSAVSSTVQMTPSKHLTKTCKAIPKPPYSPSIRPTANTSRKNSAKAW
jgi:hypothetical protein